MIKFPTVILPEYYTELFSYDMQKFGESVQRIHKKNIDNDFWNSILKRCFSDVDPKGNFLKISKSLGWEGLRNRFTNIMFHKKIHNFFPKWPVNDYCSDLKEIEIQTEGMSVEGHSRVFLFGVYFKMGEITENISYKEFYNFDNDLLYFVNKANLKTIYADWVLVLLIHFKKFLGANFLKDLYSNDENPFSYEFIYDALSLEAKKILINNLLAYSHACNDTHFFTPRTEYQNEDFKNIYRK